MGAASEISNVILKSVDVESLLGCAEEIIEVFSKTKKLFICVSVIVIRSTY